MMDIFFHLQLSNAHRPAKPKCREILYDMAPQIKEDIIHAHR